VATAEQHVRGRRGRRPEPIVDVGIPAYGRPTYLVEAIESVLGQSLENWRLRISEDGPGGGAVEEAVRPYLSDPRITYSATGERLGAAGNSTRLIRAGTAPYVHLLHDDDLLESGFLERHVEFLEANPDCGLVFSTFAEIDGDGRVGARHGPRIREGAHSIEDGVRYLLHHNPISTDCAVVRRSAYEAVGEEFDASLAAIYDYEMWLRMAPRFSFGYLAVCDTWWRRHGEQISYSSYRGEEYLQLLEDSDRRLQRERPDLRLSGRLLQRKRASAMLSAAIDAFEQHDDPRKAAHYLRQALRVGKVNALDPRAACAVVGIAFGRPGRRLAVAARYLLHRLGHRLVYHPYPGLPEGMVESPSEPSAAGAAPVAEAAAR
jgi:glycosyltransferase involved in cell wall biosynthesis